MSEIDRDKSDIRTDMRAQLAGLSDDERHKASTRACDNLIAMDEFQRSATVMLYMPLATEIDVTPIALRCFQLPT